MTFNAEQTAKALAMGAMKTDYGFQFPTPDKATAYREWLIANLKKK